MSYRTNGMQYQPTGAPAERLFYTQLDERLYMDLPVVPCPDLLPAAYRHYADGVTRFGNMVLGFAIDGALERGAALSDMYDAVAKGAVIARAEFFLPKLYRTVDEPY